MGLHATGNQQGSFAQTLAYCLPVGGVAFMLLPSGTILQDLYPKYYGLDFTTIAFAYWICQISFALVNPVIGVLSDKHRENGGGRKSWVITGFVLVFVSGYQLFVPPENLTGLYFTFWLVLMTLSWGIFDVPHLAWGAELTRDYRGRTRLFGIRNWIVTVGSGCFYVLPLLPIFRTQEITTHVLKCAAIIGLLYLLPVAYCALRFVPEGGHRRSTVKHRVWEDLRTIVSNKPFLILIGAVILIQIGQGMWITLDFIVYDHYYNLANDFSKMNLLATLVTAAGFPFFIRASEQMGKKNSLALLQLVFIALITARVFVPPGGHAFLPLLVILAGIQMVTIFSCGIIQALMADTVDYGLWRFGRGQSGSYYAVYYFLSFVIGGFGGPVGLMIIDRLGFSPHGITNINDARIAITITFFLIPLVLTGLALVFIWRLPICARRAAIIRRRIEVRSKMLLPSESEA
jgi:GPH family glycoside/pentoside/hexuronide:cation symporter